VFDEEADAAHDHLLRRFEREVLDPYHRQLPIWQLSRAEALYAVLAAYDSMSVVMAEVQSHAGSFTHVGAYQHLKLTDEGFSQALRWIAGGCTFESVRQTRSGTTLDAAGALLVHAANYALLSVFHILYSRGAMVVRVNESRRLVRFEPTDSSKHPWETFAERVTVYEKRPKPTDRTHAAMQDFLSRVQHTLVSGRIVLREPAGVLAPEVQAFSRVTLPTEALPLDATSDLVGFSMGEFRAFWFAIYCWSQVLVGLFLYHVYVKKTSQLECMPTQVVPLSEFVPLMAGMSGLDRAVVERIIDRLSYDPTSPKADPFMSPLVRAGEDVCWSPLSVLLSRAERNVLKAMARRLDLRNQVATVIGGRERPMLRELGLLLARKGRYSYKLRKGISVGDKHGEIDLLAWTSQAPSEVLLVEGKALLATDEASESLTAISEIARAQQQITRAARLLQNTPIEQRHALYPFVPWSSVDTYCLLVVTPDSQFGHAVDESLTPVATLDAIKGHVPRRGYRSPAILCEVCRTKPWLARYAAGPLAYETILIGDVTYEVPYTGEQQE
jgi:hypothetical protein